MGECECLSVRYFERGVKVKFLFCTQHHAVKVYEGMELQLHILLSSALVRGQLQVSHNFGTSFTFRHRASCILGQAFHCFPENAFYIFNQQIYFII